MLQLATRAPMKLQINGINYITAAEIIKQLGISRQTFWRWRQLGKVPAGYRFRDGRVVYTTEEHTLICEFANRVEALDNSSNQQLKLF